MKVLIDHLGRKITYLRVSITDRCNLRCIYCHPPTGIQLLERDRLLTYEELVRVIRVGAKLGIKKIRLTGGEPLVRKDVAALISAIKTISGIQEVSITTNGICLSQHAQNLKAAGVSRINISIDSLIPERYEQITGGGDLNLVLSGIHKAVECGFRVKLNTVLLKQVNEDELMSFVKFADEEHIEVRFIEFMPLCGDGWNQDMFLPLQSVRRDLEKRLSAFVYLGRDGVAEVFGYGGGKIGFITPLSNYFCPECTRLRLTADGDLRPCLFSSLGVNLFPLLREAAPDGIIEEAFLRALALKPQSHRHRQLDEAVLMRSVGG